jgi:hypothetical protein
MPARRWASLRFWSEQADNSKTNNGKKKALSLLMWMIMAVTISFFESVLFIATYQSGITDNIGEHDGDQLTGLGHG